MCRFSKYTGAGNDFVLVRAEEVGSRDASALARRVCPRATGVGVDGLILVRSLSEDSIRVRFFNPDGSEFGTCGNGSRCAARYAVERGLVEGPGLTIATDDAEVRAEVEGDLVSLRYRMETRIERPFQVELAGSSRRGWPVQVGTPHLVIPVDALPGAEFEDLVGPLRRHPRLGPEGANVDLVRLAGPDAAEIRTFERGVEGETLACGSGAMAAALALREAGLTANRLSLRTRSGTTLAVDLEPDLAPPSAGEGAAPEAERGSTAGRGRVRAIGLAGPARYLFDGVFPDADAFTGAAG